MKSFQDISFNAVHYARELAELRELLLRSDTLSERGVLKPFFEARPHLTAFIGTYAPDVGPARQIAYEFEIAGDFAADIVVGSKKSQTFCMIELEEAGEQSVLAPVSAKSTKEWSRRFEHGFSQLVDWFYALDDLRNTEKSARDFGYGHVKFHGMLIIGRSSGLMPADRSRLRWRAERVLVNSHPIHCITFDELYEDLNARLIDYAAAVAS